MSDVHEDDGEFISASIFEEPEDFRPPPPSSHFVKYERLSIDMKTGQDKRDEMLKNKPGPKEITLRLIGSSPLWGHLLWNAGKYTANYIDLHPELVQGKKVLELGAAGGLPSLICALNQPQKVVCTDYPDAELIENIRINFAELHKQDSSSFNKDNVSVQGYIWGNDYSDVQSFIRQSPAEENPKFDLIILSDLVFNHTEHHKLLQTCKDLVDPNSGKCLVVFSPHRPWLLNDDLSFFELAQTEPYGFKIEKNDLVNWKPMFEEDPETVEVRSRVYSFWLTPNWS